MSSIKYKLAVLNKNEPLMPICRLDMLSLEPFGAKVKNCVFTRSYKNIMSGVIIYFKYY